MPSTSLLSVILGATALASAPIQARSAATCATAGERGSGRSAPGVDAAGLETSSRRPALQLSREARPLLRLVRARRPALRRFRSAAPCGPQRPPATAPSGSRSSAPTGRRGHTVSDSPEVVTGTGDLPASSLEFTARIEPMKGEVVGIRNPIRHRVALPGGRLEERPRAQFVKGHPGRRGRARSRARRPLTGNIDRGPSARTRSQGRRLAWTRTICGSPSVPIYCGE